MDIKRAVDEFIVGLGKNKGRKPNERYASFDYCYRYFYTFYRENKLSELSNDENLQISCLQLGFYLASWGMLRGSSFLLERSVRHFKDSIITISKSNPKLWEIDVDDYTDESIEILLQCKDDIISALGKEYKPSDTLVTKIMMGVYANVPAFDQYFKTSFGVSSFNKKSLLKLKKFYEDNRDALDSYQINSFDFLTGEDCNICYTKAKIIDMCGFSAGINQIGDEKSQK